MICAELRKILFKRRGLLLIAAALVLHIVIAFLRYDAACLDFDMENEKPYFLSCIAQYGGRPDDRSADAIDRITAELRQVRETFPQMDADFRAGVISEQDWRTALQTERRAAHALTALSVLQQQTARFRAGEPQWLLYTNGWSVLLNRSAPDWLLLLLLGCLTAPVICGEYACEMLPFLYTTRRGARLLPAKLAAVLGLTAGVTLLFALADWLCAALRYGLPLAGCPVQSIQQMEQSPWQLTAGGAFALRVLMQIMGACYFSLLLFFLTTKLRRALPSLIAALAVTLLPMRLWEESTLPDRLPLPGGLLRAAGYLQGCCRYRMEALPLTKAEICTAVLGSAAVMLLLAAGSVLRLRLRGKHLAAVLLCLLLTGCGEALPVAEGVLYSCYDTGSQHSAGDLSLTTDETGTLLLTDHRTGTTQPLIRDPFFPGRSILIPAYYTDGRFVYRLETEYAELSGGGTVCTDRILCTDPADFTETLLYEETLCGREQRSLLGLGDVLPPPKEQSDSAQRFVVCRSGIVLETPAALYLARPGQKRKPLYDGTVFSWGLRGETLYFISDEYRLCVLGLPDGALRVMADFPVDALSLTSDGISVHSLRDGQTHVLPYE